MASSKAILEPGRNCLVQARATRLAWLIDGETAFDAIGRAIAMAERQVLLVGWDFHTRVALWPDGDGPPGLPRELLALLEARVRARRRLRVHALGWDFAALYSLEREAFPVLRFQRRTHRRIQFRLDGDHPLLASHHQKLVVVDDAVAFLGGFDLTAHRWDTREHGPDDPRRTTPDGMAYAPFHDVHVAVSGRAAVAVGELARERWRRATGRRLPAPPPRDERWPEGVAVHGKDVDVGIARTEPPWNGRPAVREVEQLYVDSIAAAARSIYVENQYLTSVRVADALVGRLGEEDGPDVVIVVPLRASGWLEEASMGQLRARLVERLRQADRFDRLRILYPHIPGLEPETVKVHAKVMVVDERLARVGSSNLSNRSMGLDTECDLALDASQRDDWRPLVAGLRDDLLAEHLGVAPARVAAALAEHGRLAAAVDALRRDEGRSLRPLAELEPATPEVVAAGAALADPEEPVALDQLRERIAADLPLPVPRRDRHRLAGAAAALAALAAVGLTLWLSC